MQCPTFCHPQSSSMLPNVQAEGAVYLQDTKMAEAAPAKSDEQPATDGEVRSNGPSEVSYSLGASKRDSAASRCFAMLTANAARVSGVAGPISQSMCNIMPCSCSLLWPGSSADSVWHGSSADLLQRAIVI